MLPDIGIEEKVLAYVLSTIVFITIIWTMLPSTFCSEEKLTLDDLFSGVVYYAQL